MKRGRMNWMRVLSGTRRKRGLVNIQGPQTGSSFGRVATYQRETRSRVSIQAVNNDVAIPTVMVTEKPRTRPEPNTNSITCARKAVALLSNIVLYARENPCSSAAKGGRPSL